MSRVLWRRTWTAGTVLGVLLASVVLGHSGAEGGDLRRLDMRWVGPQPMYPTHVVVHVYKNTTALKGTAEADFDGAMLSGLVGDDVVSITDIASEGGSLVVTFTAHGYLSSGKFASKSRFEVCTGDGSTHLDVFTSCSRILYLEAPYPADPCGAFFIEDGEGTCFWEWDDCPAGGKLYWVKGEFWVPDAAAGDLTFNVYRGQGNLRGTATARFDGVNLTNVCCDPIACITGAAMLGGDLVVGFWAHGYQNAGCFSSNTRLEVLTSSGTASHLDFHSLCNRVVMLSYPYSASPAGEVTFSDGCGECVRTPSDCPTGSSLYWVAGEFRVPTDRTGRLVFTVHRAQGGRVGRSTADLDGSEISNVKWDQVARITDAHFSEDQLVVAFRTEGHTEGGKFGPGTRFRLQITGNKGDVPEDDAKCSGYTLDLVTSCLELVELNHPYQTTQGGSVIFTDGCGECLGCYPSNVERTTWGGIKAKYR